MKNRNTSVIVLVIILILVVLGLGGYIIYDETENNNEIKEVESGNLNDCTESNHDNIEKEKVTETDYKTFVNNFKKEYSNMSPNEYILQFVENDIIPDGYEITLDKNGNLYIKYNNKELFEKYGEYKISENVLSFFVINTGQDIGNTLYYINENGTVGKADIEYGVSIGEEMSINNDIGYKNIVTILNGLLDNVHGPIFVDINGNMYN